ncbi:MAG: preprotein translocase subunit TatB, partial [Methylotenera sp.]
MLVSVFEEYDADSKNPQRAIPLISELIAKIRPEKPHQVEAAIKSIQALCYLLNQDSAKAQLLRDAILHLLSERKPISLYLIARHSVFTGFFTEMRRRVSHKVLPEAVDTAYLIDLFALFFTKTTDANWVLAVPDAIWLELIGALRFEEASPELKQACQQHMVAASQALSFRIAALGLEPELLRNYPELEKHTSPFIAQQEEIAAFFGQNTGDINHILVMLDQCSAIVSKIRRNSVQTGTSIRLTNLLQRMSQQIARLETLLHILTKQISATFETNANLEKVHLFKELVYSECHKNDVGEHWQENLEVMALRVTENASRTGEHYITNNRHEYFALMRSAMGAGVVIATMSMIKILIAKLHLAPLTEAILFSLNYG